jgi:hypothetical protein
MTFVQRYRTDPTLEQLTSIEQLAIVDIAPPQPATGVGTGNVLEVGEHEDGPFAAGGDSLGYNPNRRGVLEAFTSGDLEQKYGSFGFVRNGISYNDPAARLSAGEFWNGNGFLKLKFLKARRLFIGRVDTSVGEVQITPRATLCGTNSGPFAGFVVGAWASFDIDAGGPVAIDAIAAIPATITAGGAPAGLVAGDAVTIAVDSQAPVTVVFDGVSSAIADVVLTINTALGATIASDSGGNLALTGQILGSDGRLVMDDVVAGTVVKLGFAGGPPITPIGVGNVGNLSSVTAAELVAILNGTAGFSATSGLARVDASQQVCISADVSVLASGTQITIPGWDTTIVSVGDQGAGSVLAGTRVTDSTTTYLTMQTIDFASAVVAGITVKVRHALDDGLGVGAGAGTVNTVTDQPDFSDVGVNNALAITAALTGPQKDSRYTLALAPTLAMNRNPSKNADYLLVARRTESVVRDSRQNALDAETKGLVGRKYMASAPLGFSPDQALADVVQFRTDRLAYTYPGWLMRSPEIASRGSAGGVGFTDDGIITVRSDGPLTTLCALLNPEENPGQATDLIDQFFELEDIGVTLDIDFYRAFKAAGIAAPIVDEDDGPQYQSGVTSSLVSGRETLARRKMADFIQDSLARLGKPFSKKLNRRSNRDAVTSRFDSFLSGLRSLTALELQRIENFAIDDEQGNTPERLALGIAIWLTTVRTLSSLDALVIRTEIGPNAIISTTV